MSGDDRDDTDAASTRSSDRTPTTGELESMASLLGRLADAPGGPEGAAPIVPGAVLEGTYRVERAIGEGGMGIVYLARDLRLDRDVALKVGRQVSVVSLLRLEREAAALARLSHPNVVVVYQVGESGGRVFLAMEYVPGGTARAWLEARPRTWREIVALYAAAGDGLAAAHDAGLIHRDFKPDNVLVGDDGRPRVADFGLARSDLDGVIGADVAAHASMTQTGAVLGTPAYMPPEQLAGEPLDARADQFAFCAALWEALYGLRPFDGKTPADVAASIASARPRVPTGAAARRVPRHIAEVLRRGLASRRVDRFPSMASLLVALRRDPARRWRRIGAAAAVASAIGGAVIATRLLAEAPPDPCANGPREIARAWNPARAAELREGLGRIAPWTATIAANAITALDAWSAKWAVEYRAVCETGASWSGDLHDRAAQCLSRRRAELTAAVDVLAVADAHVAAKADALLALDDPATCADAEYLLAAEPPVPSTVASAVAPLEAALDHAHALALVGRDYSSAVLTRTLLAPAIATGHQPLSASARATLGVELQALGALGAADLALREAYFEAEAGRAAEAAVHAASARALGLIDQSRVEEARDWARLAEISASRTSEPRLRLMAMQASGRVALIGGDYKGAMASASAQVAVARAQGGRMFAYALVERANALAALDNHNDALADLDAARGVLVEGRGADAPVLLGIDEQRASSLARLGRTDEAVALQRDLVARQERLFGPDSYDVGGALLELGATLCVTRHEEALPVLDRALPIIVRTIGPRSYEVGSIHNNRALALVSYGRYDDAVAEYRQVIDVWGEVLGAEHPDLGKAWGNLGDVLRQAGRFAEADAALTTAVTLLSRVDPDSERLAFALTARGALELARPRPDLARGRADLERALALRKAHDTDPAQRANTQLFLGELLQRQGDRARSRALKAAARATFLEEQVDLTKPEYRAYLATP
ncbi:MAG: tetratricopeptide repeat protein [Deltaproteobacteria bacterium]|nr:tetratricopeptide repeat protein [Deltaproteobacteria bacterium]